MAEQRTTPLPVPTPEYSRENEALTRRNLELSFQTLSNDIELAKTQGDKPSSLAMRRFQFLLMGAS